MFGCDPVGSDDDDDDDDDDNNDDDDDNNNNNNNNNIIIIIINMPKPVYEEGDVTVLWNQAVHREREVTANRPDMIIKNKKEKPCGRQKCRAKLSEKEVKIQEFRYYNEC